MSISGLSRLGHLCIKKGVYYNEGDLVGEVEGVRVQEGNIFLDLDATGTKDERLLRAVSGKSGRRVSIHVCGPDWANTLTDEFPVHGSGG